MDDQVYSLREIKTDYLTLAFNSFDVLKKYACCLDDLHVYKFVIRFENLSKHT